MVGDDKTVVFAAVVRVFSPLFSFGLGVGGRLVEGVRKELFSAESVLKKAYGEK